MNITAGTPATIGYYTDSRAAVVTKVTAKSVWVARVETTNARNENENLAEGEMPVRIADGVLDKPVGPGERFTLYTKSDGTVYATKGDKSIRVRFGHSVTRVDYKY